MAKSTGVLYGKSKLYKTWQLGLLSKYIYEKTGKPSLLITADGGGFTPAQQFVDAGLIQPLVITNDPSRLALMRKIVEGYWPEEINKEGIRTSKKMVKVPPDTIGGYLFEGVTSIAESIQSLYRGKKTGMNPAYTEVVQSDLTMENGSAMSQVIIGGLSMDSYSLTQAEMKYLLNFSWTLPAPFIWWTGHEASSEDEMTRKVFRGLALVGSAATPRIGKDIGYLIHAYQVEVDKKVGDKTERVVEVRYYFQSHPDNLMPNVFWEASPRIAGDLMPQLLEKYPGGYFIPKYTEGLADYLRFEDSLVEKGTNDLVEWKKNQDAKVTNG